MRIAIIAIFISSNNSIAKVNDILHDYGSTIVGRFGLPRVEDGLNVITLVVKAEQKEISAMTGKLGNVDDVICQATYAKVK